MHSTGRNPTAMLRVYITEHLQNIIKIFFFLNRIVKQEMH